MKLKSIIVEIFCKLIGKNKSGKKGFSMIELSIVILIIGILIAGILASNTIIKKFRISTAQSLTISSAVNSIPDSVLWLETSLDKSFKSSESDDTSSLSAWYDIRESVNKNNATQSDSGHAPSYSNSINHIQAAKFDGTNSYFSFDGSALNNTNYTIFVLEQRDSSKSGNYFIGDISSGSEGTTNQNLTLGYSADGVIRHSQSSDNRYTALVSSYGESAGTPRIFAFVHDKSVGKKIYVNGLLAATSSDTNNLTGISTLKIGQDYSGQLGEIIIFARALTDEERKSVEDYLSKKWNSTILRDTRSSGSCVGATVGVVSCIVTCSVPTTTGITTSTVNPGSGSLTCDTSNNFTGTLPYTCTDGVFAYTGASTCSCASGYVLDGSTCISNTTSCSGGTESTITSSGITYKIHTFTSSGSLVCTSAGSGKVLVVAGGGGGAGSSGAFGGGGGGGGGLIQQNSYSLTVGSHAVTVGAGGAGSSADSSSNGTNGDNSVFDGSLTAIGGGGGGKYGANGSNGGSGGASGVGTSGSTSGGSATSGQGNSGASNSGAGWAKCGGGAGGAGAAGSAPATDYQGGGNGGSGLAISITGSSVYYSGGGAGSCANDLNNNPGPGSGGNGSGSSSYGGGGNASRYYGGGHAGGSGGPGIVVVRYATGS